MGRFVVEVPVYHTPLLSRSVRLTVDGKEKIFTVGRQVVSGKTCRYFLPSDFPEEAIKVLFGPESVVVEKPKRWIVKTKLEV